MTDWQIRVPHRTRDESLIDVAAHCRHLPADERAAVRQIVTDAAIDGLATAGDLLDRLDTLEPAQRRGLLDQARVKVGLPDTETVEARQRVEMATRAGRQRANSFLQACHAEGCPNVPITEAGSLATTNVKKWWCDAHVHLADDGDMRPKPSMLRIAPSGALIEVDPADEAREQAAAVSRRNQQAAETADRQVDAAERRASNQARDAAFRQTLPEHLRRLTG